MTDHSDLIERLRERVAKRTEDLNKQAVRGWHASVEEAASFATMTVDYNDVVALLGALSSQSLSLSEAREALKPFAKACDALDRLPDIRPNGIEDEGYNVPAAAWSDDMPVSVSLGALRRARKALENGPAGLADAHTNSPDPSLSSLRKGAADLRRAICNIVDAGEISISLEFHPLIRKRLAEAKLLIDRPALVSGSREDG